VGIAGRRRADVDWNESISLVGPIELGRRIVLVSTVNPKRTFKLRVTEMHPSLVGRPAERGPEAGRHPITAGVITAFEAGQSKRFGPRDCGHGF
jgi:hypothetical protein